MKTKDLVNNHPHCVNLLKEVLGNGYAVFDIDELCQWMLKASKSQHVSVPIRNHKMGEPSHAVFFLREDYEKIAKEIHEKERKTLIYKIKKIFG